MGQHLNRGITAQHQAVAKRGAELRTEHQLHVLLNPGRIACPAPRPQTALRCQQRRGGQRRHHATNHQRHDHLRDHSASAARRRTTPPHARHGHGAHRTVALITIARCARSGRRLSTRDQAPFVARADHRTSPHPPRRTPAESAPHGRAAKTSSCSRAARAPSRSASAIRRSRCSASSVVVSTTPAADATSSATTTSVSVNPAEHGMRIPHTIRGRPAPSDINPLRGVANPCNPKKSGPDDDRLAHSGPTARPQSATRAKLSCTSARLPPSTCRRE